MTLAVGVIFPAKKLARLQDVLDHEVDGVRFVLIDLSALCPKAPASHEQIQAAATSLSNVYGSLDALLHKLAHDMVYAELGDADAAVRMQVMQAFVQMQPCMRVVDSLESVRLLTDRRKACEMLRTLQKEAEQDAKLQQFKVPNFHVVSSSEQFQTLLSSVDAGQTKLPLICKSVEACATDRSHMMSVVTKKEDLRFLEFPALYQEFINHSSRLFKGYVLGDIINVAERRSLPNLVAGAQQVHFNTQESYPTTKDFHPHDDRAQDESIAGRTQEEIFAAVRSIGERLRDELKLTLFGFDVIVADETQDFYVIDVNYFPSYRELDDLSAILRQHMKHQCGRQ